MSKDSGETKGEAATPRRLREARRRGQVAKSAELSSALSLLGTLLCVIGMAPWAARRITGFSQGVDRSLTMVTVATLQASAIEGLWLMLQLSLIPLGVASLVHLVTLWLQTGPVFSLEQVWPRLDRINPIDGAKRAVSLRSMVQFALMLVKAAIIGTAAFLVCFHTLGDAIRVAYADAGAALAVAEVALMNLLLWCGGLFVLLGLADLAYQRWQYLRDLRMSYSEVRREHKEDQGDGKLKSQRKSFVHDPAPREQLDFVHMATLAVCDSGGRVVVLIHRPRRHPLPLFMVHGHAAFGAELLSVAREHDVPTVTDALLVDALYPAARTGTPIPAKLLDTVLGHIQRATARNR